eukprot:c26122_g1_i1 orf=37-189(-)
MFIKQGDRVKSLLKFTFSFLYADQYLVGLPPLSFMRGKSPMAEKCFKIRV